MIQAQREVWPWDVTHTLSTMNELCEQRLLVLLRTTTVCLYGGGQYRRRCYPHRSMYTSDKWAVDTSLRMKETTPPIAHGWMLDLPTKLIRQCDDRRTKYFCLAQSMQDH